MQKYSIVIHLIAYLISYRGLFKKYVTIKAFPFCVLSYNLVRTVNLRQIYKFQILGNTRKKCTISNRIPNSMFSLLSVLSHTYLTKRVTHSRCVQACTLVGLETSLKDSILPFWHFSEITKRLRNFYTKYNN